jgi:hypothetical protein
MKIKSHLAILIQITILFIPLLFVFRLIFPLCFSPLRPPGSGSVFRMRIRIHIQAAIECRSNEDPEPKHWAGASILFPEPEMQH